MMDVMRNDSPIDARLLEFVLLGFWLRGVVSLELSNREPVLIYGVFLIREVDFRTALEALTSPLEVLSLSLAVSLWEKVTGEYFHIRPGIFSLLQFQHGLRLKDSSVGYPKSTYLVLRQPQRLKLE